ncbi:MAG: DUF2300 domain-containing protein [Sulfuricurvum sp.]|uniref:DUF2300 domain-containing protein n=1 Tax=Sulfuricurvum sp. TaxID=2025608 RepID=UPI00262A55F8|nr:DUF2300 domain-containing protein [Sulfuricurvum sp.]MDD2830477.1 DUF2300 domain-containing protein [Sulfuricurvum sp.]MDD4950411.1 DUF2300 domain-containing protein [Sulfuricurvum sp.]
MQLLKFIKNIAIVLVFSLNFAHGEDNANVAWLEHNEITIKSLSTPKAHSFLTPEEKVPLGSLWKLFVYLYLADTHAKEAEYVCSTTPSEEDRYCCPPGSSVNRDRALAHSCAPYFDPNRLHISPKKWKKYWEEKTTIEWVNDIRHLTPETEVSLHDLLFVLSAIPTQARNEARDALLETSLELYGKNAWSELGSAIRYKTYSWHTHDGKAFGGAAGWLADGTPFWFGANGSSFTSLTKWSKALSLTLPTPSLLSTSTDNSCVDVSFFERYPLKAIYKEKTPIKVESGILKGNFRLEFENGNWLTITTQGEMRLRKNSDQHYTIYGRFGLNNYVARVIDREGNTTQTHAARALAVAARTYLVQNGNYQGGCWSISDSSHTQRVSATIPSQKGLEAAYFTDDLILRGAPIHYHMSTPALNQLSWRDAYAQAVSGWSFEKILKHSYPNAAIATMNGRMECVPLKAAESWLAENSQKWQSTLNREGGYEPLESIPTICQLSDGNPYSDQKRLRIYVRGWQSLNDRLTLVHEYLHLVFRYHPNGVNETYIENLARKLTGVTP